MTPEPLTRENVALLLIDLHIEDQPALFIVLSADGDTTRMGEGLEDCRERRMGIGLTSPDIFNAVRELVTPEMLDGCGRSYEAPNHIGARCVLKISFTSSQGVRRGMRWIYGSRSLDLHPQVRGLVAKAMEVTESWYRQMIPKRP